MMDHQAVQAWLKRAELPRIAFTVQLGHFEEAIFLINEALHSMPQPIPYLITPLLLDRAECSWQLHQYDQFLNDFNEYILLGRGVDTSQRKDYFGIWFSQSELLLNHPLASKFFEFYLNEILPNVNIERARCLILLGVHKFFFSDQQSGRILIGHGKHMSSNVFEEHLARWKRTGIAAMQGHDNLRARQLLQRALVLSMENKNLETRRSILSHLANVHFNLNEYEQALEAGEQLLGEGAYSMDEAKRWKERGKKLFREKNFQVLIRVYTLAINFIGGVDGSLNVNRVHSELLSMLLSNRCLAYCTLGTFSKALRDANICVKINPTWSKGHYRLGSSLVGLQRYKEGCQAFCQAFLYADDKSDGKDILLQIISAALKLPSGLEGIPLDVPKALIQDLIKRFVANKDWEKLCFLFLGGACKLKYGHGGLATGCNASFVPLELVVDSTIKNLPKFVDALIKDGAPFMGSPGCAETPLKIAARKKNKELIDALSRYDKTQTIEYFTKGVHAFEEGDYGKCIMLLRTAIKGMLNSDQQIMAYNFLSDAYYATKDYRNCIEFAWKIHSKEPFQSEELSEKWKKRGNELLLPKLYDLMTDCYSLALNYAPPGSSELRAAIYSNRSMAYLNCKKMREAKDDASRCIELRKTWFRGYNRFAACCDTEGKHQEAINVYCRGLGAVKAENEKLSLIGDIIALSMKLPNEAITIPVVIPAKLINGIVKQAVKDQDVNKLRHLFVEKRCQRPGSRELYCLGHHADCVPNVPLEMVLLSDVQDEDKLIVELLSRGASPHGRHDTGRHEKPINLAIDHRNYRIAAILLQHGADPRSLLINRLEPFDPQAPHFSQWINLGRDALRSKRYPRAERFYCLALEYPEAAKDTSAKCVALKALSDIAYASENYSGCLSRGKQGFQVSPIKSEIEAKKWQERGKDLAYKGLRYIVPDYLTLAINYAPPSNKKLRFGLLCQRSNAYSTIEDFQQAIEDARNATAIKPEDVQGHKCLLSCYKSLGHRSKIFSALVQCLKAADVDCTEKELFLREALDIAVDLPEGTTALTVEVPKELIDKIYQEAILSENWAFLRLLYLGGGGPGKHEIRKGGLATNRISAERVPVEDVVSASFAFKPETLSILLEHGANVKGLRGNASPLVYCTTKRDVESMKVLLDHRANPCMKTDNNQTLIHREVATAIDSGDFQILQVLLDSAHPDIENCQDSNGNTLYHRAMSGRINNKRCKVIRCLMNAKVNPDIPNKHGKRPRDCCPWSDDRYKMLSRFMKEYTPKPVQESNHQKLRENSKNDAPSLFKEHKEVPIGGMVTDEITEEQNLVEKEKEPKSVTPRPKVEIAKRKKEEERKYLQCLIEALIIEELDVSKQKVENEEIFEDEEATATELEEQEIASEAYRDDESEVHPQDARTEEIEESETTSPFENLTWEVDCTENVWKTMRSKRVPEKTKKQIIEKIRMLAEGRWNRKLCKRLEGDPKEKGILLFESRLTKSARIIWEKTIAFSARCSNDPQLRLSETDQGLIYSDIIRVWDIVLDHGDLDHRIQNVCKSHDRGSHCIVKASLKGMKTKKQDSNNQLSHPSYYQEREKSSDKHHAVENKDIFFPPASAEDNEYHILKFYSFTSALINTLLDSDQKTKIDFPFKVTELEHAIINLKQDKPCTIILLGRSGTGKTTCCLYRLWTEFQNYWERAINAGPHMPKYVPTVEATNEEEEESSVNETRKSFPVQTSTAGPSQVPVETTYDEEESSLNEARSTRPCQTSAGPSQIGYLCEPSSSTCVSLDKNEELQEHNSPEYYEHLHQMFITKNTVLCSEVQKNFQELKNACPATKAATTVTDDSLPNHINDIEENAWPLFIGARDWLLLLDASLPGKPFFERAPDGSLLGEIEGWGQEDTHLHFIPDDEDEEDELDEEGDHSHTAVEVEVQKNPKSTRVRNNKREVTYQVFMNELWPKMKKSVKNDYHPTLVWTEIRSFIKGSAEALETSTGFLSCDEYDQLGRKRAPNFMGDRSTVHQLFMIYQNRIRSSKKMFDEADLVYNLHQRLMKNRELEWSIHNIYVDETQDFTQAELSLLINCCRFPNRMFFTGDTAQSIMRGIAFRFEDLKTLFHAIKTSIGHLTFKEPVRVPDRLYQLTHNYRSHAGILRLASSIVNLLWNFFPESFDKLDKDMGLFEGPKPVLLESCSLPDLAMILRGNKRHASRIEFGAHQAVLVVSEEARNNMPEELKYGLVLTIYEAKGLEFDDVLIYNFFKDSHARKEWRVVIDYIEKQQEDAHSGVTGLREIREDDLNLKTRPLEFDPEKHKVLNSELKFLYTAITRARVNVWFFDEDQENRAPIFEYFRRLDIVRAITLDNQDEGSTTTLTSMFAEGSSKSEWKGQGHFFYKKGLWEVAEKCFTFGEDEMMIRKCKAQKQAQEALKNRANPKLMKEKFREAAAQFLECGMATEAEVCLYNAREKLLLAELYKKIQKFTEASKIFRSEWLYKDASQCMEETNNYSQAIEILCDAKLYQDAIVVLERYKSLKLDGSTEKNQGIIPPNPNRTIERLCYKLAKTYFNENKREEMETVLQRLPSTDRISFLKKNGCIEEAARALVEIDSKEEAAHFLQVNGRFKEAVKYSEDAKFLADCNLYEARSLAKSANSGNQKTVDELLKDALKYYRRCGDKNGEGEVRLLIGRQQSDIDDIESCGKIFHINHNVCGEVEVAEEFLKRDVDQFYYRIIVRTIERLLELIINLHKPYTQLKADKQETIAVCEQFFGLSRVQDQTMRRYSTKTFERFQDLRAKSTNNQSTAANLEEHISTKEAYDVIISGHLIHKAVNLVHETTRFLKSKLELEKDALSRETTRFNYRFEVLFNWVYLDGIVAKFCNELKRFSSSTILPLTKESLLTEENKEYYSCKLLLEFMFPDARPSTQQLSWEQIKKIRTHHAVKIRLMVFSNHLCKTLDSKGLHVDTFLQISHLRQILDMPHLNVDFFREKEKSFTEVFMKTYDRNLVYEYGMLELKSGCFEIFFRQWERGKQRMHVHGDVEESLHLTSRRFLGYAAKSISLVYPSIANTVMVLEHQLTVALAMLARINCRNQGFSALLPESYLSRLRFTDEVNCPKHVKRKLFKTFNAIDQSARSLQSYQEEQQCQRNIQSIIFHIVRLMFGEYCKRFNVFLDTFSSQETEKLVVSGVAERVMVLSLTLLANCGKNISVDCQEIILHNIFSVVAPIALPAHLKEAFQNVADVRNFSDVVGILKALLSSGNGEKLYDVRWSQREPWIDLDRKVANPINYNILEFIVDISELRAKIVPAKESFRAVPAERTSEIKEDEDPAAEDDFESEQQLIHSSDDHERRKEEEEEQKRDQAAIKIQQWFRKHNQLHRQETSKDQDHLLSSVDRLSSEFKVDSSACTICGVNFSATSADHEGQSVHFEDHVQEDLHKINLQEFQEYKEFYLTTVEKVLERAQSLQHKDTMKEQLELDLDGLEESRKKVWSIVQDIEKSKNWKKHIKGLKHLVKQVEKKIQEIEEMAPEDSNMDEIDEADNADFMDDDDRDLDPKPMPNSKNQRKAKRSKPRQRKRR